MFIIISGILMLGSFISTLIAYNKIKNKYNGETIPSTFTIKTEDLKPEIVKVVNDNFFKLL